MHMNVPAGVSAIWSRQRPGGGLFYDLFYDKGITISDMVADTIASRTSPDLWLRGGPGAVGLTGVSATYPNAERCDSTNNGIALRWNLDVSQKTLFRQCTYRNGLLQAGFTNNIASGCPNDSCSVQDTDSIASGAGDNRKRLYCVEALFCPVGSAKCDAGNIDQALTELRCSTGLAYDGSPADVVPALISATGVRFSFLDTSLEEDGFRIFRSAVDTPGKTTLIADIPTRSVGCGQPFSPIS
jgi:hypothetical protein